MSKKKYKSDNETILNLDKLNFFYGIPHCHTNISTGKATVNECIDLAIKNNLDFIIITDHNSYLQSAVSKWSNLLKTINKSNKKASNFIAIHGFEVHSKWGHFNIINSPNYFLGTISNIYSLLLWCLKDENTVISLNHPNSEALSIPYSSVANSCITNLEVGNGIFDKKYTKHDKTYYEMLDLGWQLSAINGQDNHKLNIGREENVTCIISNSFSTESIIEAFKKHRTFSTESKSLKLYFTINDTFMGSTLNLTKNNDILSFYIYAYDSLRKISKIQIISSKAKIVKEINNLDLHTIRFMHEKNNDIDEKWYIVKVIFVDKREGISSPIFIRKMDEH